jgi:hypothetical protein
LFVATGNYSAIDFAPFGIDDVRDRDELLKANRMLDPGAAWARETAETLPITAN